MGNAKVGKLHMSKFFANCQTLYKDMYKSVHKHKIPWQEQLSIDNRINSGKTHCWFILVQDFGSESCIFIP